MKILLKTHTSLNNKCIPLEGEYEHGNRYLAATDICEEGLNITFLRGFSIFKKMSSDPFGIFEEIFEWM